MQSSAASSEQTRTLNKKIADLATNVGPCVINICFIESNIRHVFAQLKATMGDKSVETLGSKIRFSSVLDAFSPHPRLPPQTMLISLFLRLHRPQCLHNHDNIELGRGGIRELTLDANKIYNKCLSIEKRLQFPKSVSTTFIAHFLEAIYANCCDFLYISKL